MKQATNGQFSAAGEPVVSPLTDNTQTAAYIVNFKPQGWVIVAADRRVEPIIGFSPTGTYETNNTNPEAQYLLDFHKAVVREARTENIPAEAKTKANWARYDVKAYTVSEAGTTQVGPLMTSTWNQSPYYNDQCPGACGDRAVTGCVATAIAQIMYYYRYPASGQGSRSYNDPATNGSCSVSGNRSLSFNTTYNWAGMSDKIAAPNSDVAKLSYHCGIASKMNYELNGSSAYSSAASDALRNYFKYSGVQLVYRSNYSASNWIGMLRTEIDNNRPMYYAGGNAANEGHAFVCNGYLDVNGTVTFHMNLGWGGSANGFYSVSGGSNNISFSQSMEVIRGITAPAPAAPTGVTATDGSFVDKVRITWTKVPGFYYRVYRGTSSSTTGMTAISGWINGNSFDDLTAQNGVTYYYRVIAATNSTGSWRSGFSGSDTGFKVPPCMCWNYGTGNICEKFEDYTVGQPIAPQSPCWTTWSGVEGGSEDGVVTTTTSGNKILKLKPSSDGSQLRDLVMQLGNRTSGKYELAFNMYVPTGKGAYFNILHQFIAGGSNNDVWAFEVDFNTNAIGYLKAGNISKMFSYPQNGWFPVQILLDLDQQEARLLVNNYLVNVWPFSWSPTSSNYVSGQLGAMNFYTKNTSHEFYVDEIRLATFSQSNCGTDTYEPNQTIYTAASMYLNLNNPGLICPAGDEDWYSFTTTAEYPNIRIRLTSLPGDYDLYLYNSNGVAIDSSKNSYNYEEKIIRNTLYAGTYRIRVKGYLNATHASDTYLVKVETSTAPFYSLDGETNHDKGDAPVELVSDGPIEDASADDRSGDAKVEKVPGDSPTLRNVPNPFSGTTAIRFHLPEAAAISLTVTDISGRVVATPVAGTELFEAGTHSLDFDGASLPNGIYLAVLNVEGARLVQKMVLQRGE